MLTTRNCHFNPRSLTGATFDIHVFSTQISISIHAPSRERRCCSISIGIPHIFQSTLPRGSDYLTATELLSIVEFQSTLPRGSDATSSAHCAATSISIHAPSRERRIGFNKTFDTQGFQSTLPRGSDWKCSIKIIGITISIHAPSRERPEIAGQIMTDEYISIHAPSRERLLGQIVGVSRQLFQSTLPRGSDVRAL